MGNDFPAYRFWQLKFDQFLDVYPHREKNRLTNHLNLLKVENI